MTYDRVLGTVVALLFVFIVFAIIAGCTPMTPDVNVNVVCAQPPTATLSEGELLPTVPPLDGADPSIVIGVLSGVLRQDETVHARELDKRRELVEFGVTQCGWTR